MQQTKGKGKNVFHDPADTLEVLRDPAAEFTLAMVRSFSDLSPQHLAQLTEDWPHYPTERRRAIVRHLVEVGESNFTMDFEAVHVLALADEDKEVRIAAIEGMWENTSVSHMQRLLALVNTDPAAEVRAAAALALGRFVLSGELGEFPEDRAVQVQDVLLDILHRDDEHLDVRRRALEAISNCSREGVAGWIEDAYAASAIEMRISALFAMGRSCDVRWKPIILEELQSDEPPILYEAARAAGELELREAVPDLADLLVCQDRELQEMAVWALGEIGGDAAIALLQGAAEDAPDEAFAEAIEDALGMANLQKNIIPFDLFDFE